MHGDPSRAGAGAAILRAAAQPRQIKTHMCRGIIGSKCCGWGVRATQICGRHSSLVSCNRGEGQQVSCPRSYQHLPDCVDSACACQWRQQQVHFIQFGLKRSRLPVLTLIETLNPNGNPHPSPVTPTGPWRPHWRWRTDALSERLVRLHSC